MGPGRPAGPRAIENGPGRNTTRCIVTNARMLLAGASSRSGVRSDSCVTASPPRASPAEPAGGQTPVSREQTMTQRVAPASDRPPTSAAVSCMKVKEGTCTEPADGDHDGGSMRRARREVC